MRHEKPLWAREPKTVGHPPAGLKQYVSLPGTAALRYNEMGGVGRTRDLEAQEDKAYAERRY